MNKTRFEKINKIKSSLEAILEEEQEYYDNLSESKQDGDAGENSYSAIDSLQEAFDALENIELLS